MGDLEGEINMQLGGMRFFWPWEQQSIQSNLMSIQLVPGGGAPAMLKLAGAAVLGAGATYALMGGAKQWLQQQQQATTSATTGGYSFTVEKGGTLTLYNPTTGAADAQTEQGQKGELVTQDMLNTLIWGGLALGVVYVLSKWRKK